MNLFLQDSHSFLFYRTHCNSKHNANIKKAETLPGIFWFQPSCPVSYRELGNRLGYFFHCSEYIMNRRGFKISSNAEM
jgi:hypothetical protein